MRSCPRSPECCPRCVGMTVRNGPESASNGGPTQTAPGEGALHHPSREHDERRAGECHRPLDSVETKKRLAPIPFFSLLRLALVRLSHRTRKGSKPREINSPGEKPGLSISRRLPAAKGPAGVGARMARHGTKGAPRSHADRLIMTLERSAQRCADSRHAPEPASTSTVAIVETVAAPRENG
jgi:hypothetical protein